MSESPLYLQYGSGLSCPQGWLNYDTSPRLRVEKILVVGYLLRLTGIALFPKGVLYGDIVKGLPHPPGSATGIYCSHVLEHLDRENVEIALANTYKLLESGGIFRLVVPDLIWRARQLLVDVDAGRAHAADHFMRSSFLGSATPARSVIQRLRAAYGNSAHRWMYDFNLLACLLQEAGFSKIRRCHFGDAADPMFALVEEHNRFWDGENEELAIEAYRA